MSAPAAAAPSGDRGGFGRGRGGDRGRGGPRRGPRRGAKRDEEAEWVSWDASCRAGEEVWKFRDKNLMVCFVLFS